MDRWVRDERRRKRDVARRNGEHSGFRSGTTAGAATMMRKATAAGDWCGEEM